MSKYGECIGGLVNGAVADDDGPPPSDESKLTVITESACDVSSSATLGSGGDCGCGTGAFGADGILTGAFDAGGTFAGTAGVFANIANGTGAFGSGAGADGIDIAVGKFTKRGGSS